MTFAHDDNRFYATLAHRRADVPVEGDLARARDEGAARDVECPSLSPDGTRIAYKQRESGGIGPVHWRLAVLDLATMRSHPLAETRNVDDQVEWLDDDDVVYGLPAPSPRR